MDENLYEDMVEDIRIKSLDVQGVLATDKCFVRKIGMDFIIDIHAVVNPTLSVKEGHDIAHALKDHLMHTLKNISNVFVHIEPFDETKKV